MESCWLVVYKNGYRVILSEKAYMQHKKDRKESQIERDEHWFSFDQCKAKNRKLEIYF